MGTRLLRQVFLGQASGLSRALQFATERVLPSELVLAPSRDPTLTLDGALVASGKTPNIRV